jgi:hypothetical protein
MLRVRKEGSVKLQGSWQTNRTPAALPYKLFGDLGRNCLCSPVVLHFDSFLVLNLCCIGCISCQLLVFEAPDES